MDETFNSPSNDYGQPETRVLGEVTALMVQRFAVAVGDMNPLYFDEEFARSSGYDGIIAPPTFLPAVLGWAAGPTESALLADGADPEIVHPSIRGQKLMGGGQSLTLDRPVRPGDVVTAVRRIVDIYDKKSDNATLTFVVTETRYHNQRHESLLSCRETLISTR